jgi:hypothetical protein
MTSKEPPEKLRHQTIFEACTILCPAINAAKRCYRMLQVVAFDNVIQWHLSLLTPITIGSVRKGIVQGAHASVANAIAFIIVYG